MGYGNLLKEVFRKEEESMEALYVGMLLKGIITWERECEIEIRK